jgi:hypothetical protein
MAAGPHPSLPAAGSLDGLGVNIHFTDPKPGELEMIAASGVKWVRMDMFWASIEKRKGVYNFSAYDPLVAALARLKLRAVFVLDYGNGLYVDPATKFPYDAPAFREGYARWVVATVSHYAGKGYLWEIWNEPNGPSFWVPQASATDYAALAVTAGKALREAGLCKDNHSGEAVIGPACSLIDLPFLETCFKAGALDYWCAVSVHPYRTLRPETVLGEYRSLRALISQYAPGSTIPIVAGEWGYTTALSSGVPFTDAMQASYLVREMLTNIGNGVPLSIWYDWCDDGDDRTYDEDNYGLVRRPYKPGGSPVYDPKPAYFAMQTLTRQLGGFTFNKEVSLPALNSGSDAIIDLFSRGPDTRVVAWLGDSGHEQYALPVGDCGLQCVDSQGQGLPDQTVTPQAPKVTLSDSPIYFTPKSPDALLSAAASWRTAPLDVPCNAPNLGRLRLDFLNPLTRPISVRGMYAPLQPGATAQILSDPMARARMPLDEDADGEGHFRVRHARLDLLSPRGLLEQEFSAVVLNYVDVRALPPGDGFELIEVENPSGSAWSAQASLMGGASGLPYNVSLPAGTRYQNVRMPVDHVSPNPGQQIRITAEGGTLTLPVPVPLPWTSLPLVMAGGNPSVTCTQTVAPATPGDGSCPSGMATFQLKYQFAKGWKYLRIGSVDASPIKGKPEAVGLWVHGDGQACRLRTRLQDATGQTFQLNGIEISWNGWRYLQMPFSPEPEHWGGANDGKIHYPLSSVYLVLDTHNGALTGEIYFSAPSLIYPAGSGSAPGVATFNRSVPLAPS